MTGMKAQAPTAVSAAGAMNRVQEDAVITLARLIR
jgi:hypothetical protein